MNFDHLFALERALHATATRRNALEVSALLAENFREVGSSGRIWSRAEIIASLAEGLPASITCSGFNAQPLAPGAVLVTYLAHITEPDCPVRNSFRSSLWQLQPDGRWLLLFHQGTLLR